MPKIILKEGSKKQEKFVDAKTVEEAMKKLSLPKAAYIALVNGKVVSEKEEIKENDVVELLKVWSGG